MDGLYLSHIVATIQIQYGLEKLHFMRLFACMVFLGRSSINQNISWINDIIHICRNINDNFYVEIMMGENKGISKKIRNY